MGKVKLFQLYDDRAEAVAGPIMAVGKVGPAVREFEDVLRRPETMPGKYPTHFRLLEVGEQDDETAEITPTSPPVEVWSGRAWLQMQQQQDEG